MVLNSEQSSNCSEVFRRSTKFCHGSLKDYVGVSGKLGSLCEPIRRSRKVLNQVTWVATRFSFNNDCPLTLLPKRILKWTHYPITLPKLWFFDVNFLRQSWIVEGYQQQYILYHSVVFTFSFNANAASSPTRKLVRNHWFAHWRINHSKMFTLLIKITFS